MLLSVDRISRLLRIKGFLISCEKMCIVALSCSLLPGLSFVVLN